MRDFATCPIMSAGVVLALALTASAESLPFKDGRYVTNLDVCSLSADAMLERFGDQIGGMERNLKGNQLDNGYELFCSIENVRRKGLNITFDALCESEGESRRILGKYRMISQTAFMIGARRFSLCPAGTTKAPLAANKEMAAENLIGTWHDADSACRGGSGNSSKTMAACDRRDGISANLRKLDWCYGRDGEAGYQHSWHRCEASSYRD